MKTTSCCLWLYSQVVDRIEEIDRKRSLALKRGTPDVPNDGRFHVIQDGEVVFSTRVESAARIDFQERREVRMSDSRAKLAAEAADQDARRFKNDVLSAKANRDVKMGSKPKH